jgi:hypothetical protein
MPSKLNIRRPENKSTIIHRPDKCRRNVVQKFANEPGFLKND